MVIHLLATAGKGPKECALALSHLVKAMERAAFNQDVRISFTATSEDKLPSSYIVRVEGDEVEAFSREWIGSIQWISPSPYRPNHKRRNWFVGISRIERSAQSEELKLKDIVFDTFRAGGPGGQHQNTTDSAVRAIHIPSELCTVSRGERSQHRNKAEAIKQLESLKIAQSMEANAHSLSEQHSQHQELERGNPIRIFTDSNFKEKKKGSSRS